MSSKQPKEDRHHQSQLVPRCLVLVLKTKRDRRSCNGKPCDRDPSPGWGSPTSPGPVGPQAGSSPGNGPNGEGVTNLHPPTGGKAIFDSFQKENSGCYWNPHLEESIRNLKYVGLVHPNSLLLCGRDIFLDTVKNAFARKVLMPPTGFTVHKVGELDPVVMSLVQQTQFTPLPEALCVVIHELNSEQVAATLDTVQERLADRYKGMQPPPEEIVYETLGSLMKERKVYHTGSVGTGYFIVTPDTYKNGCFNQAHLKSQPVPTLYVPLLTPASTEMRSISCQTEEKETEKTTKVEEKEKKKGKLERSQSMKGKSNKEKKSDSLNRTTSLRLGEEKAKQVVKDINLRTSEAHQDKDKGEKTSLFNKIFGRAKSRRSVAVEEDLAEEPEVEYATFSAQFPPPEWAWYEAQLPASLMGQAVTSHPGLPTMMRAHTWHPSQGVPHFDAGTQSDFDEEDYMKPSPHPGFSSGPSRGPHLSKHLTNGHPHHHNLQVTPLHRSSSSHSHESQSSSYELNPPPPRSPRHVDRERDVHRHRHRTSSKPRHHSLRHTPTTPPAIALPVPAVSQNEYVQQPDEDGHIYCEPSNPADLFMRNSQYEDAMLSQGVQDHLTPTELRGQSLSSAKNISGSPLNNNSKTEMSNGKSQSSPTKQRSHRAGKYRELHCPSFCGNDISIEYNGRMPKKNGMFSLSRDSGVNCVGIKDSSNNGSNPQKDKKLAILNNQTGAGSPVISNGPVNLNNHNHVGGENNMSRHQVQIHHSTNGPEYNISHSHQDSGFSSPRTDANHPNYSGELQNSLPLNNICLEENNRRSMNGDRSSTPQSRSLSREGVRSSKRSNHPPVLSSTKHDGKTQGAKEQGKENRGRPPLPVFKSLESLHITSSEKYPSYGQLHIAEEKDTATSSSRSGSSKTTVVEQGLERGHQLMEANSSRCNSDGNATYMEIQLVTSDCPVHGDSPRETPRGHRSKEPEVTNKRHSVNKASRHHHSGHWGHNRHSMGHHYGNIPLHSENNNMDKEGKNLSTNPPNNSRLAFLGDCEVVGIL